MTERPSPWWESGRHRDRRGFLLARTRILAAIRTWFADQGFVEADVGALVFSPGAEIHVQAFGTNGLYLHTSPEFAMKKLLAAGEEKIFFLGKVYRAGERGPLHAPEFTMLEWYRAGEAYERMMEDACAIARVAADATGSERLAWRERSCDPFVEAERTSVMDAFRKFAGVELFSLLPREGEKVAPKAPDEGARLKIERGIEGDQWTDVFSRVLVEKVERKLGLEQLTLLTEYPIEEAALSRPCAHDPRVAERFELYACGVELANGYGELTDAREQRRRLEAAMAEKERRYGVRWPIDEDFLAALAHMPPASGCALGVDRLIMLAAGATHIDQVLWNP